MFDQTTENASSAEPRRSRPDALGEPILLFALVRFNQAGINNKEIIWAENKPTAIKMPND
jgi:hypothetical protein